MMLLRHAALRLLRCRDADELSCYFFDVAAY